MPLQPLRLPVLRLRPGLRVWFRLRLRRALRRAASGRLIVDPRPPVPPRGAGGVFPKDTSPCAFPC